MCEALKPCACGELLLALTRSDTPSHLACSGPAANLASRYNVIATTAAPRAFLRGDRAGSMLDAEIDGRLRIRR